MGRRSKIDLLGIAERVVDLYTNQHKTLIEIEAILRGEDFDISREAIRRVVVDAKASAKKLQDSLARAKVLIDTVRENPNTDVIEATVALMTNLLFEYVQSIEDADFENIEEVSNAINRMAQAQVKIANLRLSFQKGVDKAKKAVMNKLKEELNANPELLERLTVMVATMEVKE